MSAQQLALIAAVALLVFWSLGAYNRMVALRNRIGAAFVQVDDALARRATALAALADALASQKQDATGLLDGVLAAQAALRSAADALRAKPARADRAAALAAAEEPIAADVECILNDIKQQPEYSADVASALPLAAVHDAIQRLTFARQLFNDAVGEYNAAAEQLPTRWLSPLFGFGAAGRL